MTVTTTQLTDLPLVHRGKVRETYEVDERHLLLVATDRLSAFDVVFDQPIPDKGEVLTRLSAWWFDELASLGRSHYVSSDPTDMPEAAASPELAGRSMLVRRADRAMYAAKTAGRGQIAVCDDVAPARRDVPRMPAATAVEVRERFRGGWSAGFP